MNVVRNRYRDVLPSKEREREGVGVCLWAKKEGHGARISLLMGEHFVVHFSMFQFPSYVLLIKGIREFGRMCLYSQGLDQGRAHQGRACNSHTAC